MDSSNKKTVLMPFLQNKEMEQKEIENPEWVSILIQLETQKLKGEVQGGTSPKTHLDNETQINPPDPD